jgi:hypothetical protein
MDADGVGDLAKEKRNEREKRKEKVDLFKKDLKIEKSRASNLEKLSRKVQRIIIKTGHEWNIEIMFDSRIKSF